MDDLIARLYNAFDPLQPATEREYVETSEVRGNEALAPYFLKRLNLSKTYLSLPFSGHIGGGKSSELNHLAACLRKGHKRIGDKRYLPIKLDILDYFDEFTASTTDILLAMISEIADVFRNDPELGVELKDSYMTKRLEALKGMLFTDVEIPEGEVGFGGIKAKVKTLRNDPGKRAEVRKALEQQPTQLHEALNSVLQEARIAARAKGFEDIVVLIDSLDRIEKTPTQDDKSSAHRNLFLDSAYVFADLRVHKVLTIPLSFVRAHGPQLNLRYGSPPFVLPLVKVEDRHHKRYNGGYEAFEQVVRQRIAPTELGTAFHADALEFLIQFSGGHPRLFLRFLMESLAESESLPVDIKAARKAVRPTIQTMSPSVHASWWPKLARLELSSQQQVDEEDLDVQRMLDETMILEYLNGDEETNDFEENAPWYAVHPILRELQSFKQAVEEAKREPGDGA
jgi:hypothetical protein